MMRRTFLVLTALLALSTGACQDKAPQQPTTPSQLKTTLPSNAPTDLPTGGPHEAPPECPVRECSKISVMQECQRHYGAAAHAVGDDGHGVTGWFCDKEDGTRVDFTAADMQSACDDQTPGSKAVPPTSPAPPLGNAEWRCMSS